MASSGRSARYGGSTPLRSALAEVPPDSQSPRRCIFGSKASPAVPSPAEARQHAPSNAVALFHPTEKNDAIGTGSPLGDQSRKRLLDCENPAVQSPAKARRETPPIVCQSPDKEVCSICEENAILTDISEYLSKERAARYEKRDLPISHAMAAEAQEGDARHTMSTAQIRQQATAQAAALTSGAVTDWASCFALSVILAQPHFPSGGYGLPLPPWGGYRHPQPSMAGAYRYPPPPPPPTGGYGHPPPSTAGGSWCPPCGDGFPMPTVAQAPTIAGEKRSSAASHQQGSRKRRRRTCSDKDCNNYAQKGGV